MAPWQRRPYDLCASSKAEAVSRSDARADGGRARCGSHAAEREGFEPRRPGRAGAWRRDGRGCDRDARSGLARPAWSGGTSRSETVVAGVVFSARAAAARLEILDGFVELRGAELVAHLLAHLAHHPRDALWIILVEPAEMRGIGERVQARLFALRHREPRHDPAHPRAPAMPAHRLDLRADTRGQHAADTLALLALVLVDRHRSSVRPFNLARAARFRNEPPL